MTADHVELFNPTHLGVVKRMAAPVSSRTTRGRCEWHVPHPYRRRRLRHVERRGDLDERLPPGSKTPCLFLLANLPSVSHAQTVRTYVRLVKMLGRVRAISHWARVWLRRRLLLGRARRPRAIRAAATIDRTNSVWEGAGSRRIGP